VFADELARDGETTMVLSWAAFALVAGRDVSRIDLRTAPFGRVALPEMPVRESSQEDLQECHPLVNR